VLTACSANIERVRYRQKLMRVCRNAQGAQWVAQAVKLHNDPNCYSKHLSSRQFPPPLDLSVALLRARQSYSGGGLIAHRRGYLAGCKLSITPCLVRLDSRRRNSAEPESIRPRKRFAPKVRFGR